MSLALTGHSRVAKVAQPHAVGVPHIGAMRGENVSDGTKSSALPIILGATAAVVIGVGILMFLPEPEVASEIAAPVTAEVAPQVDPVEPVEVAEPTPAPPTGPLFDTFRVETDGSMVIAGQAEPGQDVGIILAGEMIERVTADASGSFVAFPVAGLSEQPRRLHLLADPDGQAIASEASYMVAPIVPPVVVADEVPTPDQPPVSVDVATLETAPAPGAAPQLPVVEESIAPPAAPTAPTVLQADSSGVRVVQTSPALTVPNVALDAITYDPEGDVQLAGRATGDGAVQIYIDNKPLTTSDVSTGGDWRVDLPDIDTGVYTLRIDELDEEGAVVSRVETPFKREEAEEVAAVLAEETASEGFEVAVKTVQPGATLWAIAEENLGNGIFYVEVFEANTDLIRDPDLIYPGQIFRIPDKPE
ncbi:LysM peptidoglycan-binding domain-containing protein [Yoonia sp. BS5-3]|uniref:LysM peptidoglycan-binding domain-containing protein n=1 Tax=Yoonia phaeophyticola TaxID=3137369 RepID=A0ABZ3IDQ4_9RHOB